MLKSSLVRRPTDYARSTGYRLAEFAARKQAAGLSAEVATRSTVSPWLDFYEALPNPDPILRKTANRIDILNEIRRECHVKACTKSRRAGVQRRKWKIEKHDSSPQAAETITRVFEKIKVRRIIREALDGWGYGYKPLEILWMRDGDLLVPADVVGKPSEWFEFGNKSNELRLKNATFKSEPVEPYKFLLAQNEASYSNPYGEAEYSNCFWPTTFKKGGIKFWAIFLEQFGMPHAIGKTRPGADDKEINELLESLTNLIRDAAGVFPNDTTVELLETKGGSGSSDMYWRYLHYHDGEISKVLLGHASAADSTPGRLGNDTSAMDVRSDIIDDDSVMVEECLNDLIRYVFELNPQLGEFRPRFELYDENDVDKDRADRDFKLMNSKLVRFSEDYFLRCYDFKPGEVIVEERPRDETPPKVPSAQFSAPVAAPVADADAQAAVDDLLDNGVTDSSLQEQSEAMLKPIIDLVNKSESFSDLQAGLLALYPEMDDADLTATLERAMALSSVYGAAVAASAANTGGSQ